MPPIIRRVDGELIALPPPGGLDMPVLELAEAVRKRRSLREYSEQALDLEGLSFLLWATAWIKESRITPRGGYNLRNVPSAGARHPLETYLLVNRVEGLQPGVHWYDPERHGLVPYRMGGGMAAQVTEAAMGQVMVAKAAVTFIWAAHPYRTAWRYGQRGYRYLYLDAGHAGQNLHLAAEALGFGAVMIGAYYDEAMDALMGFDGEEIFTIYMAAVGKRP